MSEYPDILKPLYLILNEYDEIIDDEDYEQWYKEFEFKPITKEECIEKFLKEDKNNDT